MMIPDNTGLDIRSMILGHMNDDKSIEDDYTVVEV
jgi:hypothetical protein